MLIGRIRKIDDKETDNMITAKEAKEQVVAEDTKFNEVITKINKSIQNAVNFGCFSCTHYFEYWMPEEQLLNRVINNLQCRGFVVTVKKYQITQVAGALYIRWEI